MIVDKETHRKMIIESIRAVSWPGGMLEMAVELLRAVESAQTVQPAEKER